MISASSALNTSLRTLPPLCKSSGLPLGDTGNGRRRTALMAQREQVMPRLRTMLHVSRPSDSAGMLSRAIGGRSLDIDLSSQRCSRSSRMRQMPVPGCLGSRSTNDLIMKAATCTAGIGYR